MLNREQACAGGDIPPFMRNIILPGASNTMSVHHRMNMKIARGNARRMRKLIILTLITVTPISIEGAIQKKVHRDGTIEYYNAQSVSKRHAKRGKFSFRSPYNHLIETIAKREGVDSYLVKCVVKVESDFKADAISVAGAMGLMQIMQHIARYYKVHDPLDPEENLKTGIRHLKSLLVYFNNDIPLALAAYHAGLGRVKKHMRVPPIKSTIRYVNRVMYYYTGRSNREIEQKVKRLYKRIRRDGTIVIHD